MIRDEYRNTSVSPKRKAQEILAEGIANVLATWADNASAASYTDRELALIDTQLQKLSQRVAKVLGYKDLASCPVGDREAAEATPDA